MAEITLIEAVRQAMDEELARDENVFIVGEDVGKRGGVFRATQGLFEKYGGERVIDSPLAELSIVGVGIGAALYGMLPICEIQFADFIHPALNQIINEAAKMCYRSNGAWTVPMVIRAPYGGGIGGGLYHSQSLEALFTHIPGLKVVIPSSPYDAKGLLKSAVRDPNPVVFFEPKKGYRLIKGEVPDGEFTVPIGPANVTRPGSDLTVFSYGMMHYYSLQAAEEVAKEGIDAEVVDLRTLYPVDRQTILNSVRKTGKALIVHEDNLTGGYGAEIAATIAEGAFTDLDAPVHRLAGPDVPAVPFSHPMQDWFMLNPAKIAEAIRQLARY
ncbi:pyruvate/2-oxoglutarate dehydrogenase complex, dehydrogenase (E1) component, eukaryotic type, beta subunit [Longilinea arvoryzae]|uniref:Pyruvate/2-oxoglutarate dehydrogenase complex, dehydrogenase (E1) component, eukaryotic type, beta subunit n=1 Tax=Longilinea arvoryzae TaxID=360412 RepID=A0A0S7BCK7_9CHLR|nr:alpha-ketoacid dehydrogenase subunit beta [Longilinea arvoryzae]GAP15406.1 pyruvate/2-oxoglutarate dehydrogenase complex, dehydrogenase (E1) component, eukaryotic type, beta subunit [Longilinea arvoryzae]